MSYNATRFQSMHTQRTGLMAYLGIAEEVQTVQSTEQARAEMRAALDALEWDQEMVKYQDAFAFTHLADMSMGINPDSAAGMSPVICYKAKPVVIKHKRIGHRMTMTSFIY